MSTDGVKIIDSDTAHDTYWGIMNMYDAGEPLELIKETFPLIQGHDYDDFEYELLATSQALAMWEIGLLTELDLDEVRRVIHKGACVNVWTQEYGEKMGQARQKELDKLWKKISIENKKIRKRKKFKEVKDFLFEINDVLAFKLEDGNYHATILLNINQYRGKCSYEFGKILFKSDKLPTLDQIKESEIIGRKIPAATGGFDLNKIMAMGMEEIIKQGGLDKLMKEEAERTGSYVIGMSKMGIDQKDLTKICNKFEKIGNLNLKMVCRETGSMGGAATFEDLVRDFDDLENYIKVFKADRFNIRDMMIV